MIEERKIIDRRSTQIVARLIVPHAIPHCGSCSPEMVDPERLGFRFEEPIPHTSQSSAAAQKLVERGSCGAGGVVDPFEWGGGVVAVLDEGEHALDEVGG